MKTNSQNKTIAKPRLKLITFSGVKGFTLSNIQECLNPLQFNHLRTWLTGQTIGVLDNEPVIYNHDFERFLAELPPLD